MINELNAQQILVDIMCILLLGYSYIKISGSKIYHFPYVKTFIIFNIFANIFELVMALHNGQKMMGNEKISYFLQNGYNCTALLACFSWFVNSLHVTNNILYRKKKLLAVVSLPIVAMLTLSLTTSRHHLIFSINEYGKYSRGSLFGIFFLACGLYLFASFCFYLYADRNKHLYVFRTLNKVATVYSLMLIVCLGLQIISKGFMSVINSAGAFIALMIHEDLQQKEITVDALTLLNNRNSINDCIIKAIKQKQYSKYAVIFDVDSFKAINDTYGHVEGDNSLVAVAETLRTVFKDDSYYGRIGGDEFFILTDESSEEVVTIEDRINTGLKEILEKQNKPFVFTVSAGYCRIDESMESIPDLLNAVDKKLYMRKKEKKTHNY